MEFLVAVVAREILFGQLPRSLACAQSEGPLDFVPTLSAFLLSHLTLSVQVFLDLGFHVPLEGRLHFLFLEDGLHLLLLEVRLHFLLLLLEGWEHLVIPGHLHGVLLEGEHGDHGVEGPQVELLLLLRTA